MAKWVLPERDRKAALQIFERYAAGETMLIAPDLLLMEFASLLARRQRRKEMTAEQAHAGYALMERSAPRLVETRPSIVRALSLSLKLQLSFWDCAYLALALENNCEVLTADERFYREMSGRYPVVRLLR